jgi:transposase
MQKHIATESKDVEIAAQRLQQRDAAVSELRQCIIQSLSRRGGRLIEVPAAGTTCICHACGQPVEAEDPSELYRRCAACGILFDQDAAAARQIYAIGERFDDDEKPGTARIHDYGNDIKIVDGSVEKITRPARFSKRHKQPALAEKALRQ